MALAKRSPAALAGANRAENDHGKAISGHDSPRRPYSPVQLTGRCHADPAAIDSAAAWLAENWHVCPQPVTRTLREMFGLQFNDAVKALAEARRTLLGGRA